MPCSPGAASSGLQNKKLIHTLGTSDHICAASLPKEIDGNLGHMRPHASFFGSLLFRLGEHQWTVYSSLKRPTAVTKQFSQGQMRMQLTVDSFCLTNTSIKRNSRVSTVWDHMCYFHDFG